MTDAHCHVSCGDPSVREFLIGRDFIGVHPWEGLGGLEGLDCLHNLAPAFGTVKDDRSIELKSQFQLHLENLTHLL